METKGQCGSCALRHPDNNICQLTGFKINPSEGYCDHHTRNPMRCDICGKILIHQGTYINGALLCNNCNQQYGHCNTCTQASFCSFNADTSNTPKFVNQQFRQGNMTSVQQVRNPSLVDRTCAKGCKCFDPKIGCLKDLSTCGHYSFIIS